MNIQKYTEEIKKSIVETLDSYKGLNEITRWSSDSFEKIKNFSTKGKLIRGALICLIEDKIKGFLSNDSIKLAVAIEVLQSGLLIHDDIMDNDDIRRGEYSIHAQYRNRYPNSKNPQKLGESLGICLGDVCFFITFDIISKISQKNIVDKITSLFAKEMINVGLAQMEDIYLSDVYNTDPSYEEIYNLYRYKTARYSFSLPLITGAYLAGIEKEIYNLSLLGEKLGILFQIRDDQIDIFSSTENIGKPVGSDILNEKKTFFYYYLKKHLKDKSISMFSLEEIKQTIKRYNIDKTIDKIIDDLLGEIKNIINRIENKLLKEELKNIANFVIERDK